MPAPARSSAPSTQSQRASLPVSKPSDRSEQEATRIASRVAQADPARVALLPQAARSATAAPTGSGGQALPAPVQLLMERQLGIRLDGVRLHTDANAAREADGLDARAFTVGGDIFFGAGQYRPESAEGRELIAHELVHTVQQGAAVQRSLLPGAEVQERTPPMIQRGLFSRALRRARRYLAGKADDLPGYRLFCLAIGYNPIAGEDVARTGPAVLRAIAGVVPFGDTILEVLQNHGILARGADFIVTQFGALKALGRGIISDVKAFIADLGLSDVARPGRLWDRIKALARSSINRVVTFLSNLVSDFAALVRDAILRPLGAYAASHVPHWNLLVGVLGGNPVSDERESPGEALIGAFMDLIGQGEVWRNIQASGAIGKAWNWFRTAMRGALTLVVSIPGRVFGIFRGLGIRDLLTLGGVFGRIFDTLRAFVGEFFTWAGGTVLNLLEIILSVVAPGAIPVLKRAGAVFGTILRDPISFVRNLIEAGKQGFFRFSGGFLRHLTDGLVQWMTGALAGAGLYIPQNLDPKEILKFALSILQLSWAHVRARLVVAAGETSVKAMEDGFDLVKTLIAEGPAAAWQQVLEAVGNLKAMAIDSMLSFLKGQVVQAAVRTLASMLMPGAGFIRTLLAIWDTIQFFRQKLRQIIEVATNFLSAIAAIASGNIAAAASRVERTMVGMLALVINFLARIARIGNVTTAIKNLIQRIRTPVERGLDRVVAWVVAQARRLGKFVAQAGVPNDPAERLRLAGNHAVTLARPLAGKASEPLLTKALGLLKTRYALTSISVRREGPDWIAILAINPITKQNLGIKAAGATPPVTAAAAPAAGASPTAIAVPLAVNAWIDRGGVYEQVIQAVNVIKRLPDGTHVPMSFITANPMGGGGSVSYSTEGKNWTRTSFVHPSSLVVPTGGAKFRLQPALDGVTIRETLYLDSSNSRKNMKKALLPALRSAAHPGMFLSEGEPASEQKFGYKIDPASGKALVPEGDASADHVKSIAVHWKGAGNDWNHAKRTSWNANQSQYRILSGSLNSSLGAGKVTYVQDVTMNFRGPGE